MKALILLLLLPFVTKSQTFEKSKNTYLNENYVRYYDPTTGIIIQKVTSFNQDTSDTYYEIGLTVYSRVRSSDDFMKKNGLIVFEDKSYLQFTEQININYFQEGKHQYSIKHILSDADLKTLQSKTIDFIAVADKKNSLDKWQKQEINKAFLAIEKQ